jgi:hypothetical protein
MNTDTPAPANECRPELVWQTLVMIGASTALTGATYEIDGGHQLVVAATAE